MIGRRLSIARRAAGLSLRDLEAKIDKKVSAQAISKYERDEMMPGSDVLTSLARALGVSESYLLGQSDLTLEAIEFRKNRLTSRKEEAAVEAAVLSAVERYLEVEEFLGAASFAWSPPQGAPFPVREQADAEAAAGRLRAAWNLGIDPIPNLAEFLEEKGIKVISLPLSDKVSGLMCRARRSAGGDVPVIVVNQRDTGERQRFTLAHELAHHILDAPDGVSGEKLMHRFASAFLMPADTLWQEVGKNRSSLSLGELFELKAVFKVSVQAITYRLKDLRIIGDALYRKLFDEFERLGWRSPPYDEPGKIAVERPERFRRLCFRAAAEGAVSDSKAAELLGITVRELDRQMEQPPG
ncbi:MAG: transcriptional regulator [Betaproteobacteria bacterium RIFCSPLOWO2_02_FULL_62_17]|nr:MAG: transcriptional regulator [Betaproteobacteria bacterium RIFCSPLOWO2_02_FULL_62_17]